MADVEKNDDLEVNEDVMDDEVHEEDAEMQEEGQEDVDDGHAFPMATVVRQIKKQTQQKMISSKVKVAMNDFLGDVATSVAKEMGKTRYSMIEMDDFQRATKPYTYAKELEKEKERVVAELERMKEDLESLIREFNRKFALASVDDFSVLKKSSE